ncbi:hypothetical protein BV898_05385 [Hypsibius exemplaris]|uniref:Uncharacterized protein n=1 Tax=Hypsibius exemplaris TaxID=2072580 RepID=A0A1W0WZD7_HYPEX|nr:hypothetical protein BV898_05385 [Hypsibius exemplaris]
MALRLRSLAVFAVLSVVLHEYSVSCQTGAEVAGFVKMLKEVAYPGLRELLAEKKSWDAFGYPCKWNLRGGFHRWQWKWTGDIACTGLGAWNRGGCKSKGCAFKEPFKQYIRALAAANVAPADQIAQKVRECNCGLKQGEIDELIAAVVGSSVPSLPWQALVVVQSN